MKPALDSQSIFCGATSVLAELLKDEHYTMQKIKPALSIKSNRREPASKICAVT
jgi:hypothetical protein